MTFTVDDQVAKHASEAAQKMGKSLDQVVLSYLEQLAVSTQRDQEWAQFEQSCLTSAGKRNAWKFNRDEANLR
jgi:hypothetical protein